MRARSRISPFCVYMQGEHTMPVKKFNKTKSFFMEFGRVLHPLNEIE
jgi:hypothetical protein